MSELTNKRNDYPEVPADIQERIDSASIFAFGSDDKGRYIAYLEDPATDRGFIFYPLTLEVIEKTFEI